jgi:Caspase domain
VRPAINNVRGLHDVLTDDRYGGFAKQHCIPLLDCTDAACVGAVLTKAAQEATDTFLVYFTGHGLHGRGPNGPELFLALPHTNPDLAPEFTALPFTAIRQLFAESSARIKVLILDCCYSSLALGKPLSGPWPAEEALLAMRGVFMLASSGPYEPSFMLPGASFTAYTGALIGVLRDGIPGAGPLLRLADVASHLRGNLRQRGLPEPHHLGTGNASSVALVRNRPACERTTIGSPATAAPARPRRPRRSHDSGGGITATSRFAPPAGDRRNDPDSALPTAEDLPPVGEHELRTGNSAVLAKRRAAAEQTAVSGDINGAVRLLRELADDAERMLSPTDAERLRCDAALGYWKGMQEGGDAVAAVGLLTEIEQLMAKLRGRHDPETKACRDARDSRELRRRETAQILRERTISDS